MPKQQTYGEARRQLEKPLKASRIPYLRKKGEGARIQGEPDVAELTKQRAPNADDAGPGSMGTSSREVDSSMKEFIKKRKKVVMERGGK